MSASDESLADVVRAQASLIADLQARLDRLESSPVGSTERALQAASHSAQTSGDIVVDHGWIIDKEFGHLAHGYVVTSHASQGATVDKVFVAISSESVPATDQRTAYVAVTRGMV